MIKRNKFAIIIVLVSIFLVSGCIGAMVPPNNNGQSNAPPSSNQPTYTPNPVDNTATLRASALTSYETALDKVEVEQNSIDNYIQSSTSDNIKTFDDYKIWLDKLETKVNSYETACYAAISAGNTYKQYLTYGSSEYNTVDSNEDILKGNIQYYKNYYDDAVVEYNKGKSQYDALMKYCNELTDLTVVLDELDNHIDSAGFLYQFDTEWNTELDTIMDKFKNECNQAISAGDNCLIYYEPGSEDYTAIYNGNQELKQMKNELVTWHNEYKAGNEDINDLMDVGGFIIDILPLIGLL